MMTLPVTVTAGLRGIADTRVEPISATWSDGSTAQLRGSEPTSTMMS
jgi:hypothetical protein